MKKLWIVLALAIILGLFFTKWIIKIFFWIWLFVFKTTIFIIVVLIILALYGLYRLYRAVKNSVDE